MKQRKNLKRIISLLLIVFEMRIAGGVSNLVNMNGVKNYNELVENFSDFLLEQGIKDPQHIYEYFNYAMWNGYLSKDKELKYSVNRKVYISNPGMSIASGDAVCLNYADMLSHIFREFGYNSYMAMCYVDSDNASIERIRTDKEIDREIESGSSEAIERLFDNFFIGGITKLFGNHAITCVEYNGEVYIFDPTNLAYLDKKGFNDVEIVNGSGKFDLRYFTSIVLENINIFKVIPSTNNNDYKVEVVEKPEIDFDIDALNKFYDDNKDIINEIDKVNQRGSDSGLIELMIYCVVASVILVSYKNILKKIAYNCKEKDIKDIKELSSLLKEYFNSHDINTSFELLRNYELINNGLGIKNNFFKDLFRKSNIILNNLINDDIFYDNILVILLDELGIKASVCYAKKYHNGILSGNRVLIKYEEDGLYYYYDPEINELLYEDDKKVLHSKDNRYKYKKFNKYFRYDTLNSSEDIVSKMKEEDSLLNKEDIKELKRSKVLRVDKN